MGRTFNPERQRQARKLRAEGLTLQQIGDRLGITHQAVHYLIHRQPPRVCCRECGADLNPAGAMLHEMTAGRLQTFIAEAGGARSLLH